MKKEDLTPQQYTRILDCFMDSLMKNGMRGTTMDSIAAKLKMSKRTLYEIFGTKEEMFQDFYGYFHHKMGIRLSQIFNSYSNVMEAIVKCFLFNRDMMSTLSSSFIRDMQEYNHVASLEMLEKAHKPQHHKNLFNVLQKGVEQGYFRKDLNLLVQCRILTVLMEALKHSEQLFPKDVSLLEAYDSIMIGFLRSICSLKGLDELEHYMPQINTPAPQSIPYRHSN